LTLANFISAPDVLAINRLASLCVNILLLEARAGLLIDAIE
jgi:hypothetical protein